jgi:hypothetical protein
MNERTAVERSLQSRFLKRARDSGAELVESAFAWHAAREGLGRESLARQLGCDCEGLDRMACCMLPADDTFDRDVAAIAALGPVATELLSPVLRDYWMHANALLAAEPPADYSAKPRTEDDRPG